MYDLIIRDATIVSSEGRQVADVALRGDKVAYVGPRPPRSGHAEISARGRFLIPGVVDAGVQFAGAGSLPEAVGSQTRAAVTGGVTTVFALPHPEHPLRDAAEARATYDQAGRESFCDLGWWADDQAGNLDAITQATAEGWVAGVMAVIDGPGLDAARIAAWRTLPGLLALHWHGELPPVDDVLEIIQARPRPPHLYPLTTSAELDWIDPVRHALALTTTASLPHLFLSADDADTANIVTLPPLRGEPDRRTLWTAVKRGRLDCVASHHHADAGQGVGGSELLLPLMLHAAQAGRLSLEQLVGMCCETPARLFGLPHKGRIQKGADADLVLFAEGNSRRITAEHLVSPGATPFVGRDATPKPDLVFVAGQLVAEAGRLVGERPVGRALAKDRAA